MKIIVMGTGPFAVPTIRWLIENDHEVCLFVTRPIPDAGKRRKSVANPVREFAEANPVAEIFAPQNINDPDAIQRLESCDADLMFVCDYGQILKRKTLATTRLGGINLHGSLLPKYRGAAPINWAIYHGETIAGVTVIHMTPKLDGGPCLTQQQLEIGQTETTEQLEPRLAEIGVKAVADAIELLREWDGEKTIGTLQDPAAVTKAPRLQKQQGNIDWQQSAIQLFNQVRAFQPWPGSFTHWLPESGKAVRLIVHRVTHSKSVPEGAVDQGAPGTVSNVDDEGISIFTGDGILTIHQLQPAGKKPMAVAEFLRGRKVKSGDRFGPAPAIKA